MILKTSIVLTFNIILLNSVSGASFSKVIVQSGAEIVPVEYVQYGAPSVSVASSQLAQISAAPIGSVVPLSSAPNYLPPCGTPCVYPASSGLAIQPASPNYVTYKSSVPVVVASRDEPTGYEYSYIVYDENTGDHKSQREHSDGSVVRGEYSLIQPDGYVREVQYVADDLTGFNAVVKNFLPANVEKKFEHKEKKGHGEPCHEVKNEPLKHAAKHETELSKESNEKSSEESKEKSSEESKEKSSEESKEKSSEESKEKSSEESKEKSSEEKKEKSSEETKEKSSEESNEKSSEEKHKGHGGKSVEKSSKEHSHEKPSADLKASKSHEAKSEEEDKSVSHEGHAEPVSSEEDSAEHGEHNAAHSEESKESNEELSHKGHKGNNDVHTVTVHEGRADHHGSEGDVLVSYNDIIKCVQSAIRNSNGHPSPHQAESPLTYIILNKPC